MEFFCSWNVESQKIAPVASLFTHLAQEAKQLSFVFRAVQTYTVGGFFKRRVVLLKVESEVIYLTGIFR